MKYFKIIYFTFLFFPYALTAQTKKALVILMDGIPMDVIVKVNTSQALATVVVAVISAVAFVAGQGAASSNFINNFKPALGDHTFALIVIDSVSANGVSVVILEPAQG